MLTMLDQFYHRHGTSGWCHKQQQSREVAALKTRFLYRWRPAGRPPARSSRRTGPTCRAGRRDASATWTPRRVGKPGAGC
jgi:hypothetical protein